jgi:predicted RNA-binding Zn-ribbon protein involved in translation (DUF1610 family)
VSTLVRRCPHCGSAQDAEGECETCHEAAVRLYCPNHAPGRWLDAPPCPACGATLELGPVPARPPRPREAPPRVRPVPPAPRPADLPPPRREVVIEELPDRPARDDGWRIDPRVIGPVVRVGVPSVVGCVGRLAFVALLLLALLAAAFGWVVWG